MSNQSTLKTFAERLELVRHERGYPNQAAFANYLGVSLRTYSRWATKRIKRPPRELPSVARKLGVEKHWLWPADPAERSQLDRIEAKLDELLRRG